MSKIASADNAAMNSLFTAELSRLGATKTAAAGDIQAFADHAEYQKTLEDVLSEDTKESFDPNDPILD
jgi:hypothetical protein